jgi:hypothetical protein
MEGYGELAQLIPLRNEYMLIKMKNKEAKSSSGR